jgi:hypothetical protein
VSFHIFQIRHYAVSYPLYLPFGGKFWKKSFHGNVLKHIMTGLAPDHLI